MVPARITGVDVRMGLGFYAASTALVLGAAWFGYQYVKSSDERDFLSRLCQWDGVWYRQIAEQGYRYDPATASAVAFFPAYPLAIRAVRWFTGCRSEWAALFVSHLFLAATFVLLHAYIRTRNPKSEIRSPKSEDFSASLVLLVFALWPATFFFRLAYSEALFTFWCVLALYGCRCGWHPAWLALVAGAASGTRAAGVVFVALPLLMWWQRCGSWRRFLGGALWLAPLSVWGLVAYMVYQASAFGNPLAFAEAQRHWSYRADPTGLNAPVALLILQPVWETYDPGSFFYWRRWHPVPDALFCLYAANPVYFVLVATAVLWGWRARWLTPAEVLLGLGLLLVPYLSRAYPSSMISFGRFSAVAVPAYLVLGHWLGRLSPGWIGLVGAALALWLVAYAALVGALWWLI